MNIGSGIGWGIGIGRIDDDEEEEERVVGFEEIKAFEFYYCYSI